MIIKIYQDDSYLASMDIGAGEKAVFLDVANLDFKDQVMDLLEAGFSGLKSEIDSGKRILSEIQVSKDNPFVGLFLRDYLKTEGYEIEEIDPEVERKLNEFVSEISEDDPDKEQIKKIIPKLSYLEKTSIIEELEKD